MDEGKGLVENAIAYDDHDIDGVADSGCDGNVLRAIIPIHVVVVEGD